MNAKHTNRHGLTTIEVAVTAPLLLLFVFGGIEFSRANMMRNVAENAALMGARTGILPGATAQKCIDSAATELAILGVVGYQISVDPPVINQNSTKVTVTVSIPLTPNALPASQFILGKNLVQSMALSRESI